MNKLYENIRRLRKERGMSQEELAKLAGYTDRSSIAKIEKGLVDLNQSKIKTFADIFLVTPSELMGIADVQENEQPYFYDEEAREIANFLHENPDYKAFFQAARNVSAEDLQIIKGLIDRMKGNE